MLSWSGATEVRHPATSTASTRTRDRVDMRSRPIGSHRFDRSVRGSMLSGTFSWHEIVRRIYQRDVSEGLRKISELASKNRIIFLSQQANVIAQIQQTLEEIASLLDPATHCVVI